MPASALRVRVLGCSASALSYAFLFPPFDLAWLAPVALAPYLWALLGASPLVAAGLGALWATVATAGVAWWLPDMLAAYFDLGPAPALLGLFAVGLLIVGPFQIAFATWLAWCSRRSTPAPIAVGAAWALVEAARSYAPVPNPVGLLAYGAGDVLAQSADLAGPWGLGALLAATAAAVAVAARDGVRSPRAQRALLAGVSALVAATLYGEWRLGQRFDVGEPLRIAVVQGGVAHPIGWDASAAAPALERHLALTREAAAARPSLVFWPEFALPFYLDEPGPLGERLRREIRGLGVHLVTGANHYAFAGGETLYHNSVYVVGPRGLGARYDKTRLVPFAEYGPLGAWLRAPSAQYSAGATLQPLPVAGTRVGAFLCGEALFPDVARRLVANGADLLANPSNDAWFGSPAGAEQHLRAARMRAIENRRWVVRPTVTGYSAVVDPAGRVVARSRSGTAEVLTADVRRSQAATPAQRLGELPLLVACGVVGAGTWSARRGWRREQKEQRAGGDTRCE